MKNTNRKHIYKINQELFIHAWATFKCKIVALTWEDNRPTYTVYIPERGANWYFVSEKSLSTSHIWGGAIE